MIALLLLLLAQTEEARSEHYHVISTYRDAKYVRAVADRLESGYPKIRELLGIRGKDEPRYPVRLYATQKEYAEMDRELNDGRFANNGAFAHGGSLEAYILVAPRTGVPVFDRTEAVICHEAFHLLTYRHAEWLASCPEWLNEGMAERAAELCMPSETIKFGDSIALIQAQLEARNAISLESLLGKGQSSSTDYLVRWTWYAESWCFVKYLAENHADAWKTFLRRMAALTDRSPENTRAQLLDCVGLDLLSLQRKWGDWIRAQKHPKWVVAGGGDWRLTEDGVEGAAYPQWSAVLYRSEAVRSRKYAVSAEVRIEAEGAGQADLIFLPAGDLRLHKFWKVCITRANSTASLMVKKGETWKCAASLGYDAKKIPTDQWIRFELEVDERTIRFTVDGRKVLAFKLEDPEVELHHVHWGVGCYDSWTRFRALKFEAK